MTHGPDTRPITRRTFLAAGAGLVLAAACSNDNGGSGSGAAGTTTSTMGTTQPTFDQANAPVKGLTASSDLYAREGPQRFAFAVLDSRGEEEEFVFGDPVRISFEGPGGQRIEAQDATWRDTGIDHDHQHGIYTVEATFDAAGVWFATIELDGAQGPLPIQVNDEPTAPATGQEAPKAASPTAEQPLGVDPICTHEPPCPLHTVSLDEVVGTGTPVAVLFATPARCTSRWCGPVLDALLETTGDYDGVTFVHVEIYQDLQSNDLVPTLPAWGLESEPWLYAIDGGGTIVGRLDAAFDQSEMRALLDQLV